MNIHMKFFETHTVTKNDSTFTRYQFLWIFSFTIAYHEQYGSHLIIGIGITPFEISTQLSVWSINE